MNVLLYASDNCEPCEMVKADLDSLGVEYIEAAPESMPSWMEKVAPTVVFSSDGEMVKMLRGWSVFFKRSVQNVLDGIG